MNDLPPPSRIALERSIHSVRKYLDGRKAEEAEAALRRIFERARRWHQPKDSHKPNEG